MKKKIQMNKNLIAFIFLIFLFNPSLSGQNKAHQFDSLFSSLYQKGAFNGNVLIAENSEPVFQKSFGIANEKTGEKLNLNSVFDLASMSKQFTAMGIVLLKEQGKLSYNDTLSKFIPELKMYKNITIRNLLNHTSGLPDYMQLMDSLYNKSNIATNKDVIELFEKYKPETLFPPNAYYKYSNTGYVLLAVIIERVSHSTFANFLTENIFAPLHMNNSFVYNKRLNPRNIKNFAFGYVEDSLGKYVLPDDLKDHSYVIWLDGVVGDGSVNSTVSDLMIWVQALRTNKLISQKATDEIFTSAILNDGEQTYYGFGWELDSSYLYGKIASHTGSWAGYLTDIELHLDNHKTIIILQNHFNEETFIPTKQVRKILYNIPLLPFITLDRSVIKKYAGSYKSEDGSIKNIVIENDKLYFQFDKSTNLELHPVSETKFIITSFDPEVHFDFIVEGGFVKKLISLQPETGIHNEFVKME